MGKPKDTRWKVTLLHEVHRGTMETGIWADGVGYLRARAGDPDCVEKWANKERNELRMTNHTTKSWRWAVTRRENYNTMTIREAGFLSKF